MDVQPINIRTLVHHIEHLVLYSIILWQVTLSVLLILKWVKNNWNFSQDTPIIIHGDNTSTTNTVSPVDDNKKNKKYTDVIEVDFKKEIFIDEADNSNIKSDKISKGKVKTQKDKLRQLRGR